MVVWNVQMVLVVAGHLLSVYLAHGVALRLFPHRRQVLLSQWPMWVFMVLLTSAGLWVMAQPVVPSGR